MTLAELEAELAGASLAGKPTARLHQQIEQAERLAREERAVAEARQRLDAEHEALKAEAEDCERRQRIAGLCDQRAREVASIGAALDALKAAIDRTRACDGRLAAMASAGDFAGGIVPRDGFLDRIAGAVMAKLGIPGLGHLPYEHRERCLAFVERETALGSPSFTLED